jgi:hypothetical protein
VATKDHETEWNRLVACLVEGNRTWAARAPVLVLSVASMSFEMTGKPNRHAFHDTGLATENLILQAGLIWRRRGLILVFRPAASRLR